MQLRWYQQKAIDSLVDFFSTQPKGHPLVVVPTGGGKSLIQAAFIDLAFRWNRGHKILCLTHVKELIEQNAKALRSYIDPSITLSIYCAGLKQRSLTGDVIMASIQSIHNKGEEIGHCDVVIIDECFVAGTKISTPKGLIDIDKVRCGDIVYNQCGAGIVEGISCRPAVDIYRLELSDGSIIECTGSHPFFTSSGWRKAESLAVGSDLYSIEDMSRLWRDVQALDLLQGRWNGKIRTATESLGQAEILLSKVCEEILPNSFGCSSEKENKRPAQRDKASTYQTWRERALASFSTAGPFACPGGGLDSGIPDKDERESSKWGLPNLLQSGHREPNFDDSYRARRREPHYNSKETAGPKERSVLGSIRVVSVSHSKRESATPVFNLRVGGHPSYFANGVAVHNCHLLDSESVSGTTMYQKLLADLFSINPNMKLIGLTATPYRTKTGLLYKGKGALFTGVAYTVPIDRLIKDGYLSPMVNTIADGSEVDTSHIKIVRGEYDPTKLEEAFVERARAQVANMLLHTHNRKAVIVFCTSVAHAELVNSLILGAGLTSDMVTGKTPSNVREAVLGAYKRGSLNFIVNCGVLTTGFDAPHTDCIALMRATTSPGLYVQMVGRGLRVAPGKQNALLLDYGQNIKRHGPINKVKPVKDGTETFTWLQCPQCSSLVKSTDPFCESCGFRFEQGSTGEEEEKTGEGKKQENTLDLSPDGHSTLLEAEGPKVGDVLVYDRVIDIFIEPYKSKKGALCWVVSYNLELKDGMPKVVKIWVFTNDAAKRDIKLYRREPLEPYFWLAAQLVTESNDPILGLTPPFTWDGKYYQTDKGGMSRTLNSGLGWSLCAYDNGEIEALPAYKKYLYRESQRINLWRP